MTTCHPCPLPERDRPLALPFRDWRAKTQSTKMESPGEGVVLGETPSSFGDLPSGRISDKKAELELRKEAALDRKSVV